MWGDAMDEDIGRAVSRKRAMVILLESQRYIPKRIEKAYESALNRVKYEFQRHEPVPPKITNGWIRCGKCEHDIKASDNYCSNCGREIKRT